MYYLTALAYYLLLLPISRLPFSILYAISDGLSWLFFSVLGYRKATVLGQLRASFHDKSEAEIRHIARKFYTHLTDLLVESIKLFSISEKEARVRFVCTNVELCNELAAKNRSMLMLAGHFNNFEYAAAFIEIWIEHHAVALYKPLSSTFFEKKIRESRSRFGSGLLTTAQLKTYLQNDVHTENACILFAMDQSPADPKNAYWMSFLNQDTGVQFGAEKYSKDYDLAVIYGRINKPKRGYYVVDFDLIAENPRETPHGYITETMTRVLEKDILRAPEYWLWSHRRWKHQRPTD